MNTIDPSMNVPTNPRRPRTPVLRLAAFLLLATGSFAQDQAPSDVRILPVRNSTVTGSFWAPKLKVTVDKTLPHSWTYVADEIHAVEAAARGERGKFNGTWGEANLYKLVETAALALAVRPDPDLEKKVDSIIASVVRSQQSDGFVHAFATTQGMGSWEESRLGGGHDGYVQGHLLEAAIAYAQVTGKKDLLEVARKSAACAWNRFLGPGGKPGFCGHSEMELALVELYRVDRDRRWLDLARAFLDWHGTGVMKYGSYAQDHAPLDQQKSLEGHAVRAVFFATGVAEVALEHRRGPYPAAARRFWDSLTGRRMYITGSIGPRPENEAIGEDYELPVNGYNESCAACGLAAFAQRMFLLDRTSASGDVLERVLYNAVLHGIALDGCHSYYQNPLTDQDRVRDNNWTCCPPNLSRTLLNVGRYAYASSGQEAFILLYVGGAASFPLEKGDLKIESKTDYPWVGKVDITVRSVPVGPAALNLRRPDWCPGIRFKMNGRSLPPPLVKESGFIRVDGLKAGDLLELDMEMPVVRVQAHPKIKDCRGRIALQRGPIVFGLEGRDNGGQADIELAPDPGLAYEFKPELLGGVGVVRGKSVDGAPFLAIPYYAMANREKSSGQVWLRQRTQKQEAEPEPPALYRILRP